MITCRSQSEIEKLRRVNQLVGRILADLRAMVRPGVTTQELDAFAEGQVRVAGAEPAFKGYHGYPATICASVNEQVVHGIPSKRPLVAGDILSIDMGARLEGFYGDCAVTVPVGDVAPAARQLLKVTEESLFRGIEAVKPGARVSDIGAAVQAHVEAHGFSVVREFVGHGIGTSLHEEPQIPNYGAPRRQPEAEFHPRARRRSGSPRAEPAGRDARKNRREAVGRTSRVRRGGRTAQVRREV